MTAVEVYAPATRFRCLHCAAQLEEASWTFNAPDIQRELLRFADLPPFRRHGALDLCAWHTVAFVADRSSYV
jgi:hypothetical protein